MPRFTEHPGYPDLTVIGGDEAVTTVPLSRMVVGAGFSGYETLYTYYDAEGMPRAYALGGTFTPASVTPQSGSARYG